jgi:hypothetical protein
MIVPDSALLQPAKLLGRNDLRRAVISAAMPLMSAAIPLMSAAIPRGGLDKPSFFCNCDHGSRQAGQNAFSPEKNARHAGNSAGGPILTFVSLQETGEARTHLWL